MSKPPTRKLTEREMSEVYKLFPEIFTEPPVVHTLDECRDMKCGCREPASKAQRASQRMAFADHGTDAERNT